MLTHFNNSVSLTTSFESAFTKINEEMVVASVPRSARKSNVVSMESTIVGLKDFSATFQCVGCRSEVKPGADDLIKCPCCTTEFLKTSTLMSNQCQIKLSNNQWFSANSRVCPVF